MGNALKKMAKVRPGFPIRQIVAHEIRAEEIGPVAARAVALRWTPERSSFASVRNVLLNFEAGGKRIFRILRDEQAEKIWSHAAWRFWLTFSVIFDLLTSMVGRHALPPDIPKYRNAGMTKNLWRARRSFRLDLNSFALQRFLQHRGRELRG